MYCIHHLNASSAMMMLTATWQANNERNCVCPTLPTPPPAPRFWNGTHAQHITLFRIGNIGISFPATENWETEPTTDREEVHFCRNYAHCSTYEIMLPAPIKRVHGGVYGLRSLVWDGTGHTCTAYIGDVIECWRPITARRVCVVIWSALYWLWIM